MSRTTVREALRILEAQGLIKIKAGRVGGAFIQQPGEESVARSLELLIRGRHIRLESIHETREAIEPACARLTAVNRTVANLRDLDAANDAMAAAGDLDEFLQSNVDWHVAVAVAAGGHNEILTGIMMALSRAIYTATNDEDSSPTRSGRWPSAPIVGSTARSGNAGPTRPSDGWCATSIPAALAVEDRAIVAVAEGS